MIKRDYRDYLRDIANSIAESESFVSNMEIKDFLNDNKTINAVTRSIEVIGEAAKRLPDALKTKYPEIPWKNIK